MLLTKLANQEILNFLKTVSIKNGYFADQLKKTLVNEQYWNALPLERNPYYMHLMGRYILAEDVKAEVSDPSTGIKYQQTYSSSFEMPTADGLSTYRIRNSRVYLEDAYDEMMYVTSLDTQETIPFTRETLYGDAGLPASAVHKKTLEAYRVPGRYFDMLCKKYPKQVDLIKSIVYLIPPKELSVVEKSLYNGAIPNEDELRFARIQEADHFELLNCDKMLLEERERENMLDIMRSSLELMKQRWDVKEFAYEENFANVQWGLMWSLLPLLLVAQRYANMRTPYVHSSHVWDYLTSNGLDSYRGYLSSKQEWFLYKNIQFLKDNRGQHRVLNILIDNLLAEYSLHIESKTVVLDKTGITEPYDPKYNYVGQCAKCARRNFCLKNITDFICKEFLGTTELFKPVPMILSENLNGARKDKILTLLMTRYDCTVEEAEARYDRSFVWRDEAIELIKSELDRDQVVDVNGLTEELNDVIYREYTAGLEPIFTDDIIQSQKNDLRHVKSTYLPTKLLEITEDPVAPKYDELFTKFMTDTMLHLAPQLIGDEIVSRISESYKIVVGQEGLNFIFNFGELIAAMYLVFIRQYCIEMKTDINTGTAVNPVWKANMLSNFHAYPSFDFAIPTQARLGLTFKLAHPVKQQDLVEAYDAASEDDYPFHREIVTNADGKFKVVEIEGRLYAVDSRDADVEHNESDADWTDYFSYDIGTQMSTTGKVYRILGKFYGLDGTPTYSENTGEIGIIPKFFRWHYDHLHVQSFRTEEAMREAVPVPAEGAIATTWNDPNVWIGEGGDWKILTVHPTVQKVTFAVLTPDEEHTDVRMLDLITLLGQNRIVTDDEGNEHYVDEDGRTAEEFSSYENFCTWVSTLTATLYERQELSHYVDVDWILENLWVDFDRNVNKQDEIGEYFEKMFSIFERLDIIRSSCGDIKTKLAIKVFLESVLVNQKGIEETLASKKKERGQKRNMFSFKLVNVGDNPNPTYDDWFNFNSEIGEGIYKLAASPDANNLWDEFSRKLFEQILVNCNLSYASGTTDKSRYYKLKSLVQSLSSYLINFIDTGDNTRVSTELSHVAEDYPAHQLEAKSYVNFDVVGEVDIDAPIVDVESDIYIPTEDIFAQEGTQYFVHDLNRVDESRYVDAELEVGDLLFGRVYFIRTNLRTLLKVPDQQGLRVWTEGGLWFYDTFLKVKLTGESIKNKGQIDTFEKLPSLKDAEVGDLYTVRSLETNYVCCLIDGKNAWIDAGNWNGLRQTYPADPDVVKIVDCQIDSSVEILVHGDKSKIQSKLYLKYDDTIVELKSDSKQNDELTKYMKQTRMKHFIASLVDDPALPEFAFVNADEEIEKFKGQQSPEETEEES